MTLFGPAIARTFLFFVPFLAFALNVQFASGADYLININGRGMDSGGNSIDGGNAGASSTGSVQTVAKIQPGPVLSSPPNGATNVSTSPTVSWSSATGANYYRIYCGTSSSSPDYRGQCSGLSYPLSNLSASTGYYWKVEAYNGSGESGSSSTWQFTTACPSQTGPALSYPPQGAAGVSASLTLSWSPASEATLYRVYCGTSSSSPTYRGQTADTSYPLTELSLNTKYYWKVEAVNTCGSVGDSSIWQFTTACPSQSAPTTSDPVNESTGVSTDPTLTWSAESGAIYYKVFCGLSASSMTYHGQTSGPSYTLNGLTPFTKYYWLVEAYNSCGNFSASSTWEFTTACPTQSAPALSSPISGATNESTNLTLTWAAASGVASYKVYCGPSSSSPTYRGETTGVSYVVSGLSESALYYWRIEAFNSCGSSGVSETWHFTTDSGSARVVSVVNATGAAGSTVNVPVQIVSQGNENALGFSVVFDPSLLVYQSASLASGGAGMTMNINDAQKLQGKVGVVLALPAGQSLAAGTRDLVSVTFSVPSGVTAASTPVSFGDQPIWREVSDASAGILTTTWTAGTVTLQTLPVQTDLWVPHVTAAAGWQTTVSAFNNGGTPATFTLAKTADAGTSPAPATYTVPTHAWFNVPPGEMAYEGSAHFTSTAKLLVKVSYQAGGSPSVCEFYLTATTATGWVIPNAVKDWMNYTGIAVLNPTAGAFPVTLEAWQAGVKVGETTVEVPAGGRYVRLSDGIWAGVGYLQFDTAIIRSGATAIPAPMAITGNYAGDRHLFFTALPEP